MKKDFGTKAWPYPMPVLVIGTCDGDGARLAPLAYDPVNHACHRLGAKAGDAFKAGRALP